MVEPNPPAAQMSDVGARAFATVTWVVQCAWCRRYSVDGTWRPFTAPTAGIAKVSHGICPECLAGLSS